MAAAADGKNGDLQRYQAYLETLTFIQIDSRLGGKVGWSDITQKILIEASNRWPSATTHVIGPGHNPMNQF